MNCTDRLLADRAAAARARRDRRFAAAEGAARRAALWLGLFAVLWVGLRLAGLGQ